MDFKRFALLTTIITISCADVSKSINNTKTYDTTAKRSVNDLIFGLTTTGEITRCEIGDMKCTKIYEQFTDDEYFSPVVSLTPYEEYIYLGLESGEIRKCVLTDKVEKCTTFYKHVTVIQDLVIENDVLYAASSDDITQCHLHKSNCAVFVDEISPVYSILVDKDHLFIGSEDLILRCPLESVYRSHCLTFAEVKSAVMSLGRHGTVIYAGTKDGEILRCEIVGSKCVTVYETWSEIKALNIQEKKLHAAFSGGLIQCDLSLKTLDSSKNSICTAVATKDDILSIASVYKTIPMVYYFEDEHKICSWQGRKCPPYIIYYNETDRAPLELKVRDGKLYFAGRLFNTSHADFSHSGPKAIFVMDATGRIFVSNQHPFLLLHHSSLISGNYVASAGEISAINGEIKSITTCSGHYRPSLEIGRQIVTSLKIKGYDKYIKLIDCSKLRLLIDLDYNKLDLYYKVLFNNVTIDDVVYKDSFEEENSRAGI